MHSATTQRNSTATHRPNPCTPYPAVRPHSVPCAPNPYRALRHREPPSDPSTTAHLQRMTSWRASLEVHNIRGRCLRRVLDDVHLGVGGAVRMLSIIHTYIHTYIHTVRTYYTLPKKSSQRWGQVKSTKGFGNVATPTSGFPGVLGHGEQLWGGILKNRDRDLKSST